MNLESKLIRVPRITVQTRKVYVVDWEWWAEVYDEETGRDFEQKTYRKLFMTKHAAYRRAAWAYIINRKADRGCDRNNCAFGKVYDTYGGGVDDERCKYCNDKSVMKIAERLTRWLKWRDAILARELEAQS